MVGPTGTGRSCLACALGNKSCREGFSVIYNRMPRLFADLAQARGEGRLARLIAAGARQPAHPSAVICSTSSMIAMTGGPC
ncbi:ATP-binding protein [Bradyrhizobium sp. ISRA442]|uniref:ATP-binding protein n=1 Tax=Bradyrhizobium sp. ISRA442 TaxID=2866197 RepID=UPI00404B13E8